MKTTSKLICLLLIALLALSAGCSKAPAGIKHHVTIDIKDYGTISVELDGEHAPISVDNFLELAKSGFYDGLTFHRIMSGFMIQGGDPSGDGTGGSDKTIKGEFSANGVKNTLSFTRGAIAMARSESYDSASSQFFIMHQDNITLYGQYAVFGYVTAGMNIVDEICKNTPVTDNNGSVEKENQPVITSIKVID
jgi:peptidyl-prolyl cis-trans isomerase B (cyclophilin B)